MNQGKYNQGNVDQGHFGQDSASWICPECETINTQDVCIVCGYGKDNKKRRKKVGTVLIGMLIIIGLVLAAIGRTQLNVKAKQQRQYVNACSMIADGKYMEAYPLLSELDGYGDTEDLLDSLVVDWAEAVISSTDEKMLLCFSETVMLTEKNSRDIFDLIVSQTVYRKGNGLRHGKILKNCLALLDMLPNDISDKADVQSLISGLMSNEPGEVVRMNQELIIRIWDYPITQNIISHYSGQFGWLCGSWRSNTGQVLNFYNDAYDGIVLGESTLPTVQTDDEHPYYDIVGWKLFWEGKVVQAGRIMVYEIIPKTADSIEVFCYENGETYILYRQ